MAGDPGTGRLRFVRVEHGTDGDVVGHGDGEHLPAPRRLLRDRRHLVPTVRPGLFRGRVQIDGYCPRRLIGRTLI